MKRKRFSEEQIAFALRQAESGTTIEEICRKMGISEPTFDQWAYHNGVEIDFSRPGKPTDNAFCEAFNGRVRAECLNASWFLSMADAIERIEEWRCHDNNDRPHTSRDGVGHRQEP